MSVRNIVRFSSCAGFAALAALALGNATAAPHSVSPQLTIGPKALSASVVAPGYGLFTCQVGLIPGDVCYDPYQIRHAYGTDNLINAGYDGTGRTIVIIDAYQSPTIVNDVAVQSTFYGIPQLNLTQIAPDGQVPYDEFDGTMNGWAGEITLDVQWAHAIAPGAQIVLVLAKTSADDDILSALNYAIDNNLGDVISMSFGENESCLDQNTVNAWHTAFTHATQKGMTLFASTGDQGASQKTCDGQSWTLAASHPATDPLVSSVGGTELHAADYCLTQLGCDPTQNPAAGTYQGEFAWNELECANDACDLIKSEATGGGVSVVFDAPPFQKSLVKGKGRGVPDVAYNAAIAHGVLTFWTAYPSDPADTAGFYGFGGTSAGSPQWAAIVAIADQIAGRRLGYLNSAFYQIGQTPPNYSASFHDVTSGDNSVLELDSSDNYVEVDGYPALTRWDATTGLGSPKVDSIVGRLIAFVSPGDAVAAIATSKPHAKGKPGFAGQKQAH
ncbi:MAG TPA: S53 family peptidase [Rudaea sp.]|jgi:subtilase family serine protease